MNKTNFLALSMAAGLAISAAAQDCQVKIVVESGCIGENSGWAYVATIEGATTPYTIQWSNGGNTAYQSDLANGSYSVTVTDANNCSTTEQVSIDCTFEADCEFKTFTQGGWGAVPNGNNPGVYLHANFASCFPNGLTIGCNRTLRLTSAQAVTDFLPSGTTARMLNSGNMVNPGQSYRNVLAGQLVAAMLNVGFDACDPNFGGSAGSLGELTFIGGPFAGLTVNNVIDLANAYIGGCGSNYTASQFNTALTNVNENYDNGTSDLGYLLCDKKKEKSMVFGADSEGMSIYPVPAMESLTIDLPMNDGTAMIAMYDLTGREVIGLRNVAGVKEVLNVSSLPAGAYMVSVQMNGQMMTNRVIVSK